MAPRIEEISSPHNPLIKLTRSLAQRRGREDTGLFLAEGSEFAAKALGRGFVARNALLAAGRESGVRLLGPQGTDQAVPGLPTAGAFDVGVGPGGPWVAAGPLGLVGPEGQVWGSAAGLAGDTVYSVAGDRAGALWVGTDRGVGRVWPSVSGDPGTPPRRAEVAPRSPLPAGLPLLIGALGCVAALRRTGGRRAATH